MKINFNLKTPGAKESPIRLVVSHRNKVYRMAIGETIPVKSWRRRSQTCTNERVNERMVSISTRLQEALRDDMTDDDIKDVMREVIDGGDGIKRGVSLLEYMDEWANSGTKSTRQARGSYIRMLKGQMRHNAKWDDMNVEGIAKLRSRLEEKGYAFNTIDVLMTSMRAIMRAGYKRGYHTLMSYSEIVSHRNEVDSIYLTKDELDTLWGLKLKGSEARARDLFLLGVYTAARYSDYSKFTMANIYNGMIRYTSVKTCTPAIIPASPRLVEILERNGGAAPRTSYRTFLAKLREIGKLAGFNDDVVVTKVRGKEKVTEVKKKWELMTTHTARRTGATLLYQSGIPASQVMMITGHKTEGSFFKYIRTTKEENALMLANNPFFK